MLKRKTQELRAFYNLVKRFQESPDPNSVTTLTDRLSQMQDLSEYEQDLALEAIERIATKLLEPKTKPDRIGGTGEHANGDPSSQRLIEFLRMPKSRLHVISLVKQWFYHFCQDNEAEVESVLKELASICKTIDVSASNKLADMAALSKTVCLSLSLLKVRPSQAKVLAKAFAHNNMSAKLVEAFELLHVKQEVPEVFKQEKSVLLCHCTRKAENVDKILRDGLQVKGLVGRFGPAIYLSDAIAKSLPFSGVSNLEDGETYGVVLIVEAYLGRIRDSDGQGRYYRFPSLLDGPKPSADRLGFDTIQGPGMTPAGRESITFRDGTQSEIAIGPFTVQTQTASSRQRSFYGCYNEFALIEPARLRIRFVLLYKIAKSSFDHRPANLPVHRPAPIVQPSAAAADAQPTNRVDTGAVNDVVAIDQDDDPPVGQTEGGEDEAVIVDTHEKRTQLTYLQLSDTRSRLMKELIQKRNQYIVSEGPNSELVQRVTQKLQLFCDPDIHDHLKVLLEL